MKQQSDPVRRLHLRTLETLYAHKEYDVKMPMAVLEPAALLRFGARGILNTDAVFSQFFATPPPALVAETLFTDRFRPDKVVRVMSLLGYHLRRVQKIPSFSKRPLPMQKIEQAWVHTRTGNPYRIIIGKTHALSRPGRKNNTPITAYYRGAFRAASRPRKAE